METKTQFEQRTTKVHSSLIDRIGYNEKEQKLTVQFAGSGAIYDYTPVPKELYGQLRDSESIGSFFSKNIRKNPAIKFSRYDS